MEEGSDAQPSLKRNTSTSNSSSSSRRSSEIARKNSRRKHTSQTSTSTLRKRPSGLTEDSSLTSFPSLSPEASPNVGRKSGKALQSGGKVGSPRQEEDQDVTPRKPRANLVETLMNSGAGRRSANSRDALFADSPATTAQDVPGALHHASDEHIRTLVARRGAVPLVRQLASDLAQREAEMTTLRLRAEARELELKRMLREVEVSNLDIERRLRKLDKPVQGDAANKSSNRNSIGSVGELVGEALGDDLSARDEETFLSEGLGQKDRQATIKASARGSDNASVSSSIDEPGKKGWMNYFLGGSNTVRKQQSGTSLNVTDHGTGAKTVAPAPRRKGIDNSFFQPPPMEDQAGGTSMVRSLSGQSDTAARRASRSSWTMKLFAGGSAQKDADAQSTNRGRSSTTASETLRNLREASQSSRHTTDTGKGTVKGKGQRRSVHGLSIGTRNADVRSVNSVPLGSPTSVNPPENLGPVEMDAILPHGSRPPTLTPTYEADINSDVLTDRFGFIYDQRRRKREAEALAKTKSDQASLEVPNLIPDVVSDAESIARSSTPASIEDGDEEAAADTASGPVKRWQEYLSLTAFPAAELLSQTPSPAGVQVIEERRPPKSKTLRRMPTFGEEATSPNPAPAPSTITAGKAEIAKPVLSAHATSESAQNDAEPVKLLLAQLTELHDKLQREKTVKWNEFMRKVRAERRREGEYAAAAESKSKTGLGLGLPEASLADGEIIGIASLGHKGKVGRAKYREFKSLVLGGIPIVHRAKVWSECSGANALRIPGYYQDLVTNRDSADPTVLAQIDLDINRTLTDNVFFRSGPGVAKLKEVLIAYSQHNPEVNYCQGLNMIVGALLLIMPTTEDVFWILASLVENILPRRYYDNSLLASRADQQVLRSYVAELLPNLSAHLDDLGVELEALTFQWFLSIFTDCLTAEALYRVWDVLLCLASDDGNGGSTFLFQVALALLKLNEQQLLNCETPGEVYTYLGGEITNHAISIDGLIRASEGLKMVVKRKEVEERRRKWVSIEEETIREREAIRNGESLNTKRSGHAGVR